MSNPVLKPIAQKKRFKRGSRQDFTRNEELVFKTFLELEKELAKRPTRIKVAEITGISRKKVGQYFKSLNL